MSAGRELLRVCNCLFVAVVQCIALGAARHRRFVREVAANLLSRSHAAAAELISRTLSLTKSFGRTQDLFSFNTFVRQQTFVVSSYRTIPQKKNMQ